MMFKEILKEVVDNAGGGLAGVIMGMDGIGIEEYLAPGTELDVQAVGVEYSKTLQEIRKICGSLEAGPLGEVTISTGRNIIVIKVVNEEYFIVLVLEADGNFGKGRYLMRKAIARLKEEL
jgi:predicted regulator of Ras-like GTPase activity (Roadblock/LC7/MglB family)